MPQHVIEQATDKPDLESGIPMWKVIQYGKVFSEENSRESFSIQNTKCSLNDYNAKEYRNNSRHAMLLSPEKVSGGAMWILSCSWNSVPVSLYVLYGRDWWGCYYEPFGHRVTGVRAVSAFSGGI